MAAKAYFAPAIVLSEEVNEFNGVPLTVPVLTAAQVKALATALQRAQEETLASRPVADLMAVLEEAARRWQNPSWSYRQQAEEWLPRLTPYSQPVIAQGLEDTFAQLQRPALKALLWEEFGDPAVLDRFCPRTTGTGRVRALGPRLTTHILAGNIPGLGVLSLAHALLVKSASLVKSPTAEPLLTALFARSLAEVDATLARCLAVLWWPRERTDLTRTACEVAEAVVVTGQDETIAAVRALTPVTTRFVGQGHRLSLALVGRDTDWETAVQAVARDIVLFDQQGCLSPAYVLVEEGGSARAGDFAQRLSQALAAASVEFPRGRSSPEMAMRIQHWRDTAALVGATVYAPKETDWTVVYDPQAAVNVGSLSRFVVVRPLADLQAAPEALRPWQGRLQALGWAVSPGRQESLAERLAPLGLSRLCPLGQMQHPPATWHQDGRSRLRDLVRWVDWEEQTP